MSDFLKLHTTNHVALRNELKRLQKHLNKGNSGFSAALGITVGQLESIYRLKNMRIDTYNKAVLGYNKLVKTYKL